MKDNYFSQIEERMKRLVEGNLPQISGQGLPYSDIRQAIHHAMEDNVRVTSSGYVAPNKYLIQIPKYILSEHDATQLKSQIMNDLITMAQNADYTFKHALLIDFLETETRSQKRFSVTATHDQAANDTTQTLHKQVPISTDHNFPEASLMFQEREISLTQSIVNIGRHRNNHIILESPSVSRHHAQIRCSNGHFYLFDMKSRAGTRVNERQIEHVMLQTGDVIVIGIHKLVYFENRSRDTALDDTGNTRPFDPNNPPEQ